MKTSGARQLAGFGLGDLLMTLAAISILTALVVPITVGARNKRALSLCLNNVRQVGRATLMYANENSKLLPAMEKTPQTGVWWWYKERVKQYAGLTGKSSPQDKLFACPNDRGFEEDEGGKPFSQSARFDYGSYPFNGVNLPGVPNITGKEVTTIREPQKTLLVMEWTAHAPLSWHRSRTGRDNSPFYNNAESVVCFVDGRAALTRIYYDGMNAAYTRDPIDGYEYKYSGD